MVMFAFERQPTNKEENEMKNNQQRTMEKFSFYTGGSFRLFSIF